VPRHRSTGLSAEQLESRQAPATLAGATRLTYQDADGDSVAVVFSRPLLTPGNVNSVFTFFVGGVNGSNLDPQQLRTINLSGLGAAAAGTSVTVTAKRSPVRGGDGFANVGQIDATGIDLGPVMIDGDLGRILAGDSTTATTGLKGLTVHSLGQFGIHTGAPDLATAVQGKLGFLTVKADVRGASVSVQGGADGRLGAVIIGGSLLGGIDDNTGRLFSTGDMGLVRIRGDLIGGGGAHSGEVLTQRKLAGATVGGSVRGGSAFDSGEIVGNSGLGFATIGGDLIGGDALDAGEVSTGGNLLRVAIGGSVRGGTGFISGTVSAGSLGLVTIRGDLVGGSGQNSGLVNSFGTLGRMEIGGSLAGGPGQQSGLISAADAGAMIIGGDIVGGSMTGTADLALSGSIQVRRLASLTLGGSLIAGTDTTTGTFFENGAILAGDDLGTVLIKGSVIGNFTNPAIIAARGRAVPTATADVAIGKLTVLGRVEFAEIRAGYDASGAGVNADAQIGAVAVGGDWIASSLVAGALAGPDGFFGDGDDTKMSGAGVKDDAQVFSKVASISIGGEALGALGLPEHFGIVAEVVGTVSVGGTVLPLSPGPSNDDFAVGITGDFRVNEV
jgi:hypothetical protein